MTYKEKLQKEHPDKINPYTYGGCNGCPCDYGYERMEDKLCREKRIHTFSICGECWNREIPEESTETQKAYQKGHEDGCQEAWDFARKIYSNEDDCFSIEELSNIFKDIQFSDILEKNSYKQARKIYDAYILEQEEEKKKIHVGDVVLFTTIRGVVVCATNLDYSRILCADGNLYIVMNTSLKKTGEHIDLTEIFKKLGGAADGQ